MRATNLAVSALGAVVACGVDYRADQDAYDELLCARGDGGCPSAMDGGTAGSAASSGSGGAGGSAGDGGSGGDGGTGGAITTGGSGGGGSGGASGGGSGGVEQDGGAGTGGVQPCASGNRQCVGNAAEVCVGGQWVSTSCTGQQPECENGACVVCASGRGRCSNGAPELCVANAWQAQAACTGDSFCQSGTCVLPPSCVGLPATCGATNDESCCASPLVSGGTYYRSNDGAYPATVSDFLLDKYEVSVGRFRKFVELYPTSRPTAGGGAHPRIPGSGWDPAWDTDQPLTQGILVSNLGCTGYATWTASPGPDENKPINCVSWYTAFMFCAWDGGRLPTEAEWNYAAAGGAEQRLYPWGDAAPPPDAVLAVYNCYYDDFIGMPGGGSCSLTSIAPVGARVLGNGRWGHADLAGNMHEFNFDSYESAYPTPCVDCAAVASTGLRVVRGGGFNTSADTLLNSARNNSTASFAGSDRGIRCARTP